MIQRIALTLSLLLASASVLAEPLRFDFEFIEAQGTARANGYIVLETDLITNPGDNNIELPSPAVLDLSVTVTGATSGNGTFGLADFTSVVFDTNGGTLNFGQQLIGQPTDGEPWGTSTDNGIAGDFNLFSGGMNRTSSYQSSVRGASAAPNGEWWFTLAADGGTANEMVLASMIAVGAQSARHPVPVNQPWALAAALTLIAALGLVALRRRLPR